MRITPINSYIRHAFKFVSTLTALLFTLTLLSCVTPWYTLYGIDSEENLYKSSSVPNIVKALENEDPHIRKSAIGALIKMGGAAKASIPALTKAVDDPNSNVRNCAIVALKTIALEERDSAKETVPGLIKALGDDIANNRIRATEALHQIALKDKEIRHIVLSPLKEAMKDVNQNISFEALRAVIELDPGSDEAIPIFKSHLSSVDADSRRNAVLELREGHYPKTVFYDYLDHLANHDPHSNVRLAALTYLKGGNSKEKTHEVASHREPYTSIEEGPKGFVQVDMVFTKGTFPLSLEVKKIVDNHPMLLKWSLVKPFSERPGFHIYSVRLGNNDPQIVLAQVTEGMLTAIQISATLLGVSENRMGNQIMTAFHFNADISTKSPSKYIP